MKLYTFRRVVDSNGYVLGIVAYRENLVYLAHQKSLFHGAWHRFCGAAKKFLQDVLKMSHSWEGSYKASKKNFPFSYLSLTEVILPIIRPSLELKERQ